MFSLLKNVKFKNRGFKRCLIRSASGYTVRSACVLDVCWL
jgi:hypothetical protein